jgi:hypothetical protein
VISRCIALLVRRSRPALFATQMSYTRSGIPADKPVTPSKRSNASHAVAPTTGINPTWPANLTAIAAPKSNRSRSISYSHGVSAPTTHKLKRVHSTPVCHTDYVPPSGFCTLLTAFSSLERPALFHAGNAHGVPALQGFSLTIRSRQLVTGEITLLAFLLRSAQ